MENVLISPKFKVGDKVVYLPSLSGMKKHKLVVESYYYKDYDALYDALGLSFEPTYIYRFVGTSLTAIESDLK